jgi:hypothetical protein
MVRHKGRTYDVNTISSNRKIQEGNTDMQFSNRAPAAPVVLSLVVYKIIPLVGGVARAVLFKVGLGLVCLSQVQEIEVLTAHKHQGLA